jgi:hypothetical protein
MFEQGGLPDPRLSDERDHATATVPRLRQQTIERQPLLFAAQKHSPSLTVASPMRHGLSKN